MNHIKSTYLLRETDLSKLKRKIFYLESFVTKGKIFYKIGFILCVASYLILLYSAKNYSWLETLEAGYNLVLSIILFLITFCFEVFLIIKCAIYKSELLEITALINSIEKAKRKYKDSETIHLRIY